MDVRRLKFLFCSLSPFGLRECPNRQLILILQRSELCFSKYWVQVLSRSCSALRDSLSSPAETVSCSISSPMPSVLSFFFRRVDRQYPAMSLEIRQEIGILIVVHPVKVGGDNCMKQCQGRTKLERIRPFFLIPLSASSSCSTIHMVRFPASVLPFPRQSLICKHSPSPQVKWSLILE